MEVEPPGAAAVARIAVWQVEPPRRPVAGAETSVRVVLQGWGVDGKDIPVELWSEGRKLGEKRVRFTRRGDVVEAMLPLKPEKPGSYPYEIRVRRSGGGCFREIPAFRDRRAPGRTQRPAAFQHDRLRGQVPAPRSNHRPQRAPRQLRPLAGRTLGQLRRWRRNGEDTLDLSAAALSSRAAVVLADVSPDALNPAQWQALADYAAKGGGLVVLGGPNLLGSPQAAATIGRILPVPTPAPHRDGRFGVKLTDAGLRHPVFGPLFEAVKDFPALQGANFATGVAGNAQVLMEAIADGQSRPLVVVKQQGGGRVAVVLSDTLWRWRVAAPGWTGRLSAYDTFWSQMLDWLAPDQEGLQSGGRIELTADRPFYRQGDKVGRASRVDRQRRGSVQVAGGHASKSPAGTTKPVRMQPSVWQNPDGRRVTGFRGETDAGTTGVYEVEARAAWTGGEADSTMRFAVAASPEERRGEAPDAGFLQAIAKQSGGAYFARGEGDKWLDSLPKPGRQTEREVVTDVWNHPAHRRRCC